MALWTITPKGLVLFLAHNLQTVFARFAEDEDVTGAWRFESFRTVEESSFPLALDSTYWGTTIYLDNGAANVTVTLPSIGAGDIDKWLVLVRRGTGTVTIQAADADTIASSSVGGYLVSEETRTNPFISLMVTTSDHWTPALPFGAYGEFNVY